MALWIAALAAMLPALVPAATLSADRVVSTDGVVQLSWGLDGRPVELQRGRTSAFSDPHTVYRGSDSASLRTGLPDGDYWFRLRAQGDANWSDPVQVSVSHHGAARTWGLFGLGALVFVAIIGVILGGNAREAHHE